MKRIIWSRFFRNWFHPRRVTGTRAARKQTKRSSVCLRVENLEDRTLLSAPTFTVNIAGDAGTGSGNSGDIRYIINKADIPTNTGATIVFDTTGIGSSTITLTHGELDISNNMSIENTTANPITISGNYVSPVNGVGSPGSRVLNITNPLATVTLNPKPTDSQIVITNGNGSPTISTTAGNQGGDIFNGGDLILNNVLVENGFVLGVVGGPAALGGGIFNAEGSNGGTGATLTLNNTTIESNKAEGADGINSPYLDLPGGAAGFGAGGGIYNDTNATLNIQNGTEILNNTALGGKGGNGLRGPNGGNNASGGPGGAGGSGGAALGGGLYNTTGGTLSILGTNTSSIIVTDNVAQGGLGGNGDFGGNGGNATVSFLTGPGGGAGGAGGTGGSTLGGGLYNTGSILTLQYTQFAGNQALGGGGGTAAFGGHAGNGGGKAPGGAGGVGGSGGNGGGAVGGAIYSAGGNFKVMNTVFTTDAAGVGSQAIGGAGNTGNNGGGGGNGGTSGKPAFHLGGEGGEGGAGGSGGAAAGGAVFNGNAGGNVSFTNVTTTATLARGGAGAAGFAGGVGGTGGAGGNGGAAGNGGGGGVGGAAQGGAVYNSGGSLTFKTFSSTNSKANAGNGNAGGNGGGGGHGGGGGGANASTFSAANHGGDGAAGGKGGAGGVGGAAQGGGFYNSGGILTVTGSTFSNDSVSSGTGSTGGNAGNGGVGGKGGKVGFFGGHGGIGGEGGDGGNAGYAEGGGGANAGGNATITGSTFTIDLVQAGNGGLAGNGGNGGKGGDAAKGSVPTAGPGGLGGKGGNGGSGSSAQGGGLSVTGGTLDISTTTFGGSSALADQVLGGNGGNGGIGGVINLSGAPNNAYGPLANPPGPNGGNGGTGGAGTTVSGGGLAVTPNPPPTNLKVIKSFPGISLNGASQILTPPDTQGAAGPSNYIETVNQAMAIYNKTTGAAISTDSMSDFFFTQGGLPHVSATDGQSDTFVVYDNLAQRFIVGDLDFDFSQINGAPNALLIAVSKSNDPKSLTSSDWYFYEVNTTLPSVALQDYPGNVGYNADALVITQNSFSETADIGTFVNAISIKALTSGTALTLGTNLFQNEYTPQQIPILPRPVTMTDATAGGAMWMVASAGEGGEAVPPNGANTIDVLKMTNVLSANPTFTTTTLNVNQYYGAVPPLQPNGSPLTFQTDSRIMNADEVNNQIVADQIVSDQAGDEDNSRWYQIDVSSGTPKLVQEGDVSGGPSVYDMYPGIAMNSAGAIGMSFIQSGTSSGQFMSIYVTGRLPTDPVGTMERPTLVAAGSGVANIPTAREGDMSGINVDPTDGTFWIANEYANTQPPFDWGTAIAHFTVQAVPPPSRSVTLTDVSSDDNILVAGNSGMGGAGGLLPIFNYAASTAATFFPDGGNCGDGGSGGDAQGGGIYLGASAMQIANLNGVSASGNSFSGGQSGQGAAAANPLKANAPSKGGSNSGAGGAGGSVEGGGLDSVNYQLTVDSSAVTGAASQFNSNTGTAGSGGAGGGQSLDLPNTARGGNGGVGGSAKGGGIAFENELPITLALSITGVSALKNQMTAGAGGAGGGAGSCGHDHLLGGAGGAGGQALGGGVYVFASNVSVNTTTLTSDELDDNSLTAGSGGNAGPGSSATSGQAAGKFATGGSGGDALGGGVYDNTLNTTTGDSLTLGYSTMAGNQLTAGNGALGATGTTSNGGPGGNGGNGGNAEGGGFYDGNSATLTVFNTTIGGPALSSQSATANSNILTAGSGGSGNDAGTPASVSAADGGNGGNAGNALGGGVYANSITTDFVNDTIVYNQAVNVGFAGAPGSGAGSGGVKGAPGKIAVAQGGGYFAANGTHQVGNTIIDLNAAGTAGNDVFGTFTSLGNNILGFTTGATGFNTGSGGTDILEPPTPTNPDPINIGPLLNNGGPTQTDALLNNTSGGESVAIDAGSNALVTSTLFGATPTDQRGAGFPRIANSIVDIGAYELNLPIIAGLTPSSAVEGSPSFTMVITGSGFETGATVDFGGTVLTPTSITGSKIVVTIPGPVPVDSDSPILVTVGNPDGSGIPGETLNSVPAKFTINEAAFTLVNPGDQTNDVNDNVSLTINPAGPDTLPDVGNFSATGLPAGLSINATTGVISGTVNVSAAPSTTETYAVTIKAYDGGVASGTSTSITFNWVVNPFTLANPGSQSNNEGDTVSLPITSSTGAVATNYVATGLPTGLSINSTTGVISGTIGTRAAGPYTVTVTAGQGQAIAHTIFAWTVNDTTPPVVTNPGDETNFIGDTVSLPITAVDADSYAATGLPTGLSINASTGVISGTITGTKSNIYNVTVTATDDGNPTSVSFEWNARLPFSLANPGNQSNDESDGVDLQMSPVAGYTANNYSATGLPTGLSINPSTGLISGTIDPRGAGNYTITVRATDTEGQSASVTFSWTVYDTTPPVLTDPGLQTSAAGQTVNHLAILAIDADPGSFTDEVNGVHTLPPGLSIDANGVISGTISLKAAGNYTITIQASDSYKSAGGTVVTVLSAPTSFLWSISPAPPAPPAPPTPPTSPVSSTPGIPPGVSGLATNVSIVSVQNTYPGFVQVETVTAVVTNANGYIVNQGFVTFQVDGETLVAPVINGVASVTFSTSLFDFADLFFDYLFPHGLTASYSDSSTNIFAPSGAGTDVAAIWIDFIMSLLGSQTQVLTQSP